MAPPLAGRWLMALAGEGSPLDRPVVPQSARPMPAPFNSRKHRTPAHPHRQRREHDDSKTHSSRTTVCVICHAQQPQRKASVGAPGPGALRPTGGPITDPQGLARSRWPSRKRVCVTARAVHPGRMLLEMALCVWGRGVVDSSSQQQTPAWWRSAHHFCPSLSYLIETGRPAARMQEPGQIQMRSASEHLNGQRSSPPQATSPVSPRGVVHTHAHCTQYGGLWCVYRAVPTKNWVWGRYHYNTPEAPP